MSAQAAPVFVPLGTEAWANVSAGSYRTGIGVWDPDSNAYLNNVAVGSIRLDFRDPVNHAADSPYTDIYTFCTDLDVWAKSGFYTRQMVPQRADAPPEWYRDGSGNTRFGNAAWLYNQNWQNAAVIANPAEAAAMQIAIWEMMFDPTFDLAAGSSRYTGVGDINTPGTLANKAMGYFNTALAHSDYGGGTALVPGLTASTTDDPTWRTSQNFLYPAVPEPSTYIAIGLLALPVGVNVVRMLLKARN
jgi:hypothetical protein